MYPGQASLIAADIFVSNSSYENCVDLIWNITGLETLKECSHNQ